MFDTVHVTLVGLTFAPSKFQKHYVGIVMLADSSHAACDSSLNAVLNDIVGGVGAFSQLDKYNGLFHVTSDLNTVRGSLVVLLAGIGREELDESVGRTWPWLGNSFESATPD